MVSRITVSVLARLERLRTTRSGKLTLLFGSFLLGIAAAATEQLILFPLIMGVLFLVWNGINGKVTTETNGKTKRLSLILMMCLFAFMFGVFRYQIALPNLGEGSIVSVVGESLELEGYVADEVIVSGSGQRLTLELDVYSGKILVRVPRYPEFKYGDRLRVTCRPELPEPFDGFRYDRWLMKEGVLATCSTFQEPFLLSGSESSIRGRLLALKSGISTRIEMVLHEPYAGLLKGLLLGEKALPNTAELAFRRSGLSHIVAASGQNVALVVMVLFGILITFMRRRSATIFLLFGIGVYVVLAGADAAIVRAGIMGSVLVASKSMGRIPSMVNLLMLVAVIMLTHNPFLLRDDVGFQLSFAATAGIAILEPKISGFLTFIPRWFGLRESLSSSLAAIAATLPIILYSFGEVSLVAPLANLIVLPLIPYAMGLGAVVLLISTASMQLAVWLSAPAAGSLKIILAVAKYLSDIPFAAFATSDILWFKLVLMIIALIVPRALLRLPSRIVDEASSSSWKLIPLAVLILSLPIIPIFDLRSTNSDFKFHTFSIGQGDAAMLELPAGERFIIDGGPNDDMLHKVGQLLPWYERKIDTVVATHADADHITGLVELAKRYEVGELVLSQIDMSSPLLARLIEHSPNIKLVRAGDDLSSGNTSIKVLGPTSLTKDRNDNSVVLLVEYGDTSILLTGDAPQKNEFEILDKLEHVDVLKAGHHGSHTSTSQELLDKIKPDIAIISVGAQNRYGHPHGIVLFRLQDAGAEVYRTDLDGDILIQTDGGEPVVERGRLLF